MKAVRDLCGCWSPLPCAISIGRRAVARDDLDSWMRSEPLGHRLGRPIREQCHGMAAFQSNEHRTIGVAFPQGEVIYTEHLGRGKRRGRLLAPRLSWRKYSGCILA